MGGQVFPGVFVSHGAPTLAVERGEAVEFLKRLGGELGRHRALSADARAAHPTEEHLLPLFVALGAGGAGGRARALHSFTHGSFGMAAYAFG